MGNSAGFLLRDQETEKEQPSGQEKSVVVRERYNTNGRTKNIKRNQRLRRAHSVAVAHPMYPALSACRRIDALAVIERYQEAEKGSDGKGGRVGNSKSCGVLLVALIRTLHIPYRPGWPVAPWDNRMPLRSTPSRWPSEIVTGLSHRRWRPTPTIDHACDLSAMQREMWIRARYKFWRVDKILKLLYWHL